MYKDHRRDEMDCNRQHNTFPMRVGSLCERLLIITFQNNTIRIDLQPATYSQLSNKQAPTWRMAPKVQGGYLTWGCWAKGICVKRGDQLLTRVCRDGGSYPRSDFWYTWAYVGNSATTILPFTIAVWKCIQSDYSRTWRPLEGANIQSIFFALHSNPDTGVYTLTFHKACFPVLILYTYWYYFVYVDWWVSSLENSSLPITTNHKFLCCSILDNPL